MSTVAEEKILVVPTALFRELGYFQGFSDRRRPLPAAAARRRSRRIPPARRDGRGSQLQAAHSVRALPLDRRRRHGRTCSNTSAAAARANAGCTPSAASASAGIFRRSTPRPAHLEHVYREGMRRELAEEVVIDTPYTETIVGLINDDETPVGRVHLGRRPPVRRRAAATFGRARPTFSTPASAPSPKSSPRLDEFESWSRNRRAGAVRLNRKRNASRLPLRRMVSVPRRSIACGLAHHADRLRTNSSTWTTTPRRASIRASSRRCCPTSTRSTATRTASTPFGHEARDAVDAARAIDRRGDRRRRQGNRLHQRRDREQQPGDPRRGRARAPPRQSPRQRRDRTQGGARSARAARAAAATT